jgi:hypothetical protein
MSRDDWWRNAVSGFLGRSMYFVPQARHRIDRPAAFVEQLD